MIDGAAAKGSRILAGGGRGEEGGCFFQPTVLADVPLDAKAMIDEPFGPVALIRPFAGDEDAIAEANRLPYGLAAYCFTESGRRQNVLAEAVETGIERKSTRLNSSH